MANAPLISYAVALIVTWLLTPLVRRIAIAKGAVDDPKRDDRRIHKAPLPRWGGFALYGGLLVSCLAVLPLAFPGIPLPPYLIGLLVVAAALVIGGAWDDLLQFSAKIQIVLLLGAGALVQLFADGETRVQLPIAPIFAIPATMITIFILTKTMDTIDGVDGLASGLATISAVTLMFLGVRLGWPTFPVVAAAIAGVSMGFLQHNYNPAKITLGTGGAYILGFMLSCLCIIGVRAGYWATPLFLFFVPLVDAAQVMIQRYRAGVPLSQADKRHVHHLLLKRGLNQRQTVFVLWSVSACVCALYSLVVVKP